jgi:pantetheine-phosphate adenylyltransferase
MEKYKTTVCGGTFDLLHKGHKSFIKRTMELSDKVVIGITSDKYIHSFKNNLNIEDFEIRKQAVIGFLRSIGVQKKATIVAIDNAFEPYLETSSNYSAIVVTPQTKKSALEINLKRKQNGVTVLKIITVPFWLAEDGKIISSTRIRNGEINREGKLFVNPKWRNKKLILPKNLRSALQAPWGEVISSVPINLDSAKVITIGDATTIGFNKKNVGQFLSIIDFLIHRKVEFHTLSELGFKGQRVQKVNNLPGTISFELFVAIESALKSRNKENVILIDGEDDLAVMPAILLSPLGISIFYGQPDKGLVRITVNEENKERAYKLALSFDTV